MSASWTAEDFRLVRISMVAASALAWTVMIAIDTGRTPLLTLRAVLAGVLVSGGLHLGLMLSLGLERGDWCIRLFGAVMMIPNLIAAAAGSCIAVAVIATEGRAGSHDLAGFIPLLGLHAVQLWRLTGVPFPRVQPLALPPADDTNPVHES